MRRRPTYNPHAPRTARKRAGDGSWVLAMRAEGRCEYCGATEAQNGRCSDCRKLHNQAEIERRRALGVPEGKPVACRNCGTEGHNRRTCGAP